MSNVDNSNSSFSCQSVGLIFVPTRLLAEFYAGCSKIMNMVEALAEASGL